jgi:DNA-binding transcriptional MerR regulator
MSWSITQLARMFGATTRALRHYDEIGLPRPARVGANGHRWYERGQLLRLQEILLMRQLDMDLPTIARILDGEHDRLAAQRDHRERLLAERDRVDRLDEVPVDDPRVLDLMAEAHAAEQTLLVLSKEEYCALAQASTVSPELRAHLDARHPHLAEYLRDAMLAYAAARLS